MTRPLGRRQARLLDMIVTGGQSMIMPAGFLDRRALRRLTERGVLEPALSFPDCWREKR
jgi:hypothetical protein